MDGLTGQPLEAEVKAIPAKKKGAPSCLERAPWDSFHGLQHLDEVRSLFAGVIGQ